VVQSGPNQARLRFAELNGNQRRVRRQMDCLSGNVGPNSHLDNRRLTIFCTVMARTALLSKRQWSARQRILRMPTGAKLPKSLRPWPRM